MRIPQAQAAWQGSGLVDSRHRPGFMMKNSTRIATTLLLATLAHPSLAGAAEPTPAVDPIYLAPAATLEASRIAEVQQRLLAWPQLDRYRA